MKRIYDYVLSSRNQPSARYSSYDDDLSFGYDDYDEDYSEDEGTTPPINAKTHTTTTPCKSKPDESLGNLLNGYTSENFEINVNKLKMF